VKIGVLALQGDFALHARALARCLPPPEVVEVRKPEQLDDLDGLVIPGGESTTLLKLMEAWGFERALATFHEAGKPIFGTCAGLIVMARDVTHPAQPSLGLIDVGVERNAYGRQRDSFEVRGSAALDHDPVPVHMVFIRAPRIRRVGESVRTLARHAGDPVLARQATVLVATFHPELTDDVAVHAYFCRMVAQRRTPVSEGLAVRPATGRP
jgi:5'-phosphate synthase pdxT subunit